MCGFLLGVYLGSVLVILVYNFSIQYIGWAGFFPFKNELNSTSWLWWDFEKRTTL